MNRALNKPKYEAVQEAGDNWCVIDTETQRVYVVRETPMASLSKEIALALADALNNVCGDNRTVH